MTRLRWLGLATLLIAALGVAAALKHSHDQKEEREREARVACVEEVGGEAAEKERAREELEREREGKEDGEEHEVECPEDIERELEAPYDAFLTRELSGSDRTSPPQAYVRAIREADAMPRSTAAPWSFVGPTNIGGRVLDIALDKDDPNTVYAATSGGGVMKSTDGGKTFASSWPANSPNAIGALVSAPDGTLYAGTGEAGPGGGALTYGGTGIYKSTDKGATWTNVGLERTARIGRIVIDPKNPNRIFVAALGNLFKGSDDRGLYRSEDAGKTWTKVLKGDNGTTGAADIAIDPTNPQRMLATMWDAQRTPQSRRYTGAGSGLYRSTDGGTTWTRIGAPLLTTAPIIGRMGVAIDPKNPDTVFVIVSGGIGNAIGLFKSTDFGTTLIPSVDPNQYATSGAYTYGWWFGRVWVDPNDSNGVYVAGVGLLHSTNGGTTFDVVSGGFHADQHAMVWDSRVKGRLWLGNDGGVYRSDNDGDDFVQAKVQPFSQPDALDVSEQDPTKMVAGLQDNGQIRSYPKTWNEFGGGDGQRVLINPKDKDIVYGCSQNGNCTVSHDGGDSNTDFTNLVISARKPFFVPIEFDPENPSTIYTGGEILNRSDDDGASFTPISPDLSNGPGLMETNPLYANSGALSAIAPAPRSTGTIYVGTDDGNIQYTHTGGGLTGWTKATDPVLPKAWVTRITVDPKDANIAYAAFSGFRSGDNAAYLVRTKDGGKTWANLTGDLPKMPVQDIVLIDNAIVVATDVGVYSTLDDGQHWFHVGDNLPQVPVYELRPHAGTQTIYAATFGRSIWKIPYSAATTLPVATPAVPSDPRKSYLGLPKVRSCKGALSKRLRFRLKLPKGQTAARATVRAGNGRTLRLTGKRLKRYVVVKLPAKGKVTVRVTVRTRAGKLLKAERTYRACPTKKRA